VKLLNRILKIEHWSRTRLVTLTFYTACACMLLFLVLAGNSALLWFLRSYTLLL